MTWREVIEGCSLGHLVPEVTLRHTDVVGGEGVVISRRVRHRDTGAWGEISVTYPLPAPAYLWPDARGHQRAMCRFLLQHVQMNLAHEVSENFCFRGERVFDPHAPQERCR